MGCSLEKQIANLIQVKIDKILEKKRNAINWVLGHILEREDFDGTDEEFDGEVVCLANAIQLFVEKEVLPLFVESGKIETFKIMEDKKLMKLLREARKKGSKSSPYEPLVEGEK